MPYDNAIPTPGEPEGAPRLVDMYEALAARGGQLSSTWMLESVVGARDTEQALRAAENVGKSQSCMVSKLRAAGRAATAE